MIYFTSDLHFGHDRDFIYGPRGFKSIEEHDETIIERWNKTVTPHDEVFILGDLMLGADHEYGLHCLNQLNGVKYFIKGNHDTDRRCTEYESIGISSLGLAYIFKHERGRSYLCHYPTETSCLENMTPIKNHLVNFYGHTHSLHKFEHGKPYQYNVALDAHDCYPVSLEEAYDDIYKEVQKCLSYL